MKVLLCGGGTAGHVMPAVAIAEIIEKHFKNTDIRFAGRDGGAENASYQRSGKRLYTVEVSGFSRSLSINNIKSVFRMIKSSRNARRILKEFEPDVIIGTGGYVCYPFIRQGQRMNIPTVIHESNAYPGLVTRLLGKRCDKLLLNMESAKEHLRSTKNVAVVGNPVRSDFGVISKAEAKKRIGIKGEERLVVSFGGSLGAERLNKAVAALIKRIAHQARDVQFVHATGRSGYTAFKERFSEIFALPNVKVVPYIENMPILLTAADLAITRSGAMTVSELARSATPSILIPSPNVTANHQYANALYMHKAGAAMIIEEADLSDKLLYDSVSRLLRDGIKLSKMSRAANASQQKSTDKMIISSLLEILKDKQ